LSMFDGLTVYQSGYSVKVGVPLVLVAADR
jgi:hypothetical protein